MNRKNSTGIHEFCESDVKAVRDLIHHTIDVSYSPFYPPRAVKFFKEYHSEVKILERHKSGYILVVEKNGILIGTGSLVGKDILGVFIHPDVQHQGFGKSLMQAIEGKAMTRGIREVELSVSLPSRRFYERIGYEIVEDCSIDVGEGQRLEYWEAKKKSI